MVTSLLALASTAGASNATLRASVNSWSRTIGIDAHSVALAAQNRHPRRMTSSAVRFRTDALRARPRSPTSGPRRLAGSERACLHSRPSPTTRQQRRAGRRRDVPAYGATRRRRPQRSRRGDLGSCRQQAARGGRQAPPLGAFADVDVHPGLSARGPDELDNRARGATVDVGLHHQDVSHVSPCSGFFLLGWHCRPSRARPRSSIATSPRPRCRSTTTVSRS